MGKTEVAYPFPPVFQSSRKGAKITPDGLINNSGSSRCSSSQLHIDFWMPTTSSDYASFKLLLRGCDSPESYRGPMVAVSASTLEFRPPEERFI